MKRLALFDFDGTITTKDTLIEFIRYYHGTAGLLKGLTVLSPILIAYKSGIIPNWRAKEKVLHYFFQGDSLALFNKKCIDFVTDQIPALIRPAAQQALREHVQQGDQVVVVSASPENWVKPWCDQQNVSCIATCLESKKGLLTGKISGRNCYGEEKVLRIKTALQLGNFSEIIAYGDSSGDKPMLALAHRSFYKPFRNS